MAFQSIIIAAIEASASSLPSTAELDISPTFFNYQESAGAWGNISLLCLDGHQPFSHPASQPVPSLPVIPITSVDSFQQHDSCYLTTSTSNIHFQSSLNETLTDQQLSSNQHQNLSSSFRRLPSSRSSSRFQSWIHNRILLTKSTSPSAHTIHLRTAPPLRRPAYYSGNGHTICHL